MLNARRVLACAVCLVGFATVNESLCLAGIGEWKTYTAKSEVRGVVFDGHTGTVWAATSGGLFSYRVSDSTFNGFTTSDGLRTIDLTAIALDSNGTIWSGGSNGFIHAYHQASRQWQYVSDIFSLNAPQKQVNALQAIGDTLFILSDIGVSTFSISRMEFGDTYSRFGSAPNQLVSNATSVQTFNGRLWVSTSSGIASTPTANTNPSAPESWQVYTVVQGLPSNSISGFAVLNDTLYAGTSLGLAYFTGTSWNGVQGTLGSNIINLVLHPGCPGCAQHDPPSISFITPTQYGTVANSNTVSLSDVPYTLTAVARGNIPVLGTQSAGVLIHRNGSWISIVPPGPPTNGFYGMAVDDRGVLWSGTGTTSTIGFVRFDGQSWREYSPQTDPELGSADSGGGAAFQINIGSNGTKWVSLFGNGVAMVDENDVITHVFNTSTGLAYTTPQTGNKRFVVVMGVATDLQGNAWINVRSPSNDSALAVYTPSTGSFRYVRYPSTTVPVLTGVAIDSYGTLWFTTTTEGSNSAPGLVLYNPASGWDVVTKTDGFTDNEVSAVAVDNDQNIWAGTVSGGINIIFDPTSPHDHILIYHPLNDQIIYGILVDPINNKWVATGNGVFVLSSDGTSILNQYTTESTDGKIPDDNITSLAIDRRAGIVYIGTAKGLAALSTTAAAPVQSFSGLTISPNPFLLPSAKQLTVDGLMEGSSLKILSIDGRLIRDLTTPGGRIGFWDGMDNNGNLVGTGVYIVVAYSSDGTQVATGKVAVIRK